MGKEIHSKQRNKRIPADLSEKLCKMEDSENFFNTEGSVNLEFIAEWIKKIKME